jgi:hypothetical protein
VHLVIRDLKVAKKPYRTPTLRILDPSAVKAELEVAGRTQTADTRLMLSALNQQPDGKKSIAHSASRDSLP